VAASRPTDHLDGFVGRSGGLRSGFGDGTGDGAFSSGFVGGGLRPSPFSRRGRSGSVGAPAAAGFAGFSFLGADFSSAMEMNY